MPVSVTVILPATEVSRELVMPAGSVPIASVSFACALVNTMEALAMSGLSVSVTPVAPILPTETGAPSLVNVVTYPAPELDVSRSSTGAASLTPKLTFSAWAPMRETSALELMLVPVVYVRPVITPLASLTLTM